LSPRSTSMNEDTSDPGVPVVLVSVVVLVADEEVVVSDEVVEVVSLTTKTNTVSFAQFPDMSNTTIV
ncbi:MAG: hypothetical protein ACTSV8_07500, partial [Candidatus Thorarchaeota archaeon]